MSITKDEGSILITLIVFVAICTLILGTGIVFIQNGNKRFLDVSRKNQALYLAEAGIDFITQLIYESAEVEELINDLKNNPRVNDTFQLENELKGRYIVKIWKDESDGSLPPGIIINPTENLIISTGEVFIQKNGEQEIVPFGSKTVNCKVIRPLIPGTLFNNAIAAKQNITIGGSSIINGNAQAGQDSSNKVSVENSSTINGNIKTTGIVEIKGQGKINGIIDQNNPQNQVTMPIIDQQDIINWRNVNWSEYNGNIFSSDLKITGDYTFNSTYIDGSLNISGNGIIILEGNPIIYVKKDINISGTVKIKGTGIFVVEEGNNPSKKNNTSLSITGNVDNYDTNDKKPKVGFINLGTGSTKISGNSVTAVVFSSNGDIDISGNSQINGSVIGNIVTTSGSSQINYQIPEVQYDPISYLGPIQITQWVERF